MKKIKLLKNQSKNYKKIIVKENLTDRKLLEYIVDLLEGGVNNG